PCFDRVRDISFWGTPVTDEVMSALLCHTNTLIGLHFGNTKVTAAGWKQLREFRQNPLGTLEVTSCPFGDEDVKVVGELQQLVYLSLMGTQITDAGLAHLKGLARLDKLVLGQTGITDAGLAHLLGMPRLQELGLWDLSITDKGLQQLK